MYTNERRIYLPCKKQLCSSPEMPLVSGMGPRLWTERSRSRKGQAGEVEGEQESIVDI